MNIDVSYIEHITFLDEPDIIEIDTAQIFHTSVFQVVEIYGIVYVVIRIQFVASHLYLYRMCHNGYPPRDLPQQK